MLKGFMFSDMNNLKPLIVNTIVEKLTVVESNPKNEYHYDFNSGVLPSEFDSTKFEVENGKLKTTAPDSSFTFPTSKECSIEFKIKASGENGMPKFSLQMGNTSLSFVNNFL